VNESSNATKQIQIHASRRRQQVKIAVSRIVVIPVAALAVIAGLALVSVGAASANGAGGVTGPAFYVDGELYRTVGTPNDLSNTGAPDHSFDTIYEFDGVQTNVATAGPGDADYNGGRWRVHLVTFNTDMATTIAVHDMNGSGDLDSAEEVHAALADGGATGLTDNGIVKSFTCPVIPLPGGHS
jgi:hypothetical protein